MTSGNTTARGYGGRHQTARKKALAAMHDGEPCARCGRPMYRDQALDLDHTDDRAAYNGLAHRRCNQLAGARKGGRATARRRRARIAYRQAQTEPGWHSQTW